MTPDSLDIVVVGGGPWSPDTNFPTHHTARILARSHRVLYLCRSTHVSLLGHLAGRLPGFHTWPELAGRVATRPKVEQVDEQLGISPLAGPAAAIPLSYPPVLRALSARLVTRQLRFALRTLRFRDPLLWFYWWFFPEIADAVPHRLAVYDMYDDHAEYDYVRSNPHRQAYTRQVEEKLLDRMDLAFAVSHKLVRDKSADRAVRYLPNGVDVSMAERARAAPLPPELAGLPRPIVGYLGSYDSRLNWSLVDGIAAARSDWSFVFVGGGITGPERRLPNLHLLGNRSYPEALRYVHAFDLALIPFVRDALTEAVCPAKLFDYLALGKPVLSTPLPAVGEIVGENDLVYRGETVEDFLNLAERALHEDSALPRRRLDLARSFTWERRADQAMAWIGEALSRRGEVA